MRLCQGDGGGGGVCVCVGGGGVLNIYCLDYNNDMISSLVWMTQNKSDSSKKQQQQT